jgi:beta-lactamase regulating signal transducer with metallopeptidase domain
MTDFLIESSATMLLLLLIYRLLLEREKMHRFNRFYLLFALIFSIAVPFISFTIYEEVIIAPFIGTSEEMPVITAAQRVATPVNYLPYLLIGLYLTVTLLLAFRFLNNLMHFKKKMVANPTVNYKGATLVLLTEKAVPHTFLHYIFINRQEYEDGHIEEQLFTHELAHVNQKHTIDVLFIELLKTIFWFNPLLYFYKKAIQLNHEFLADESVLATTHNVISYQQLLLQKALPSANYQLASSLNFSLTKKRFTMMTKVKNKGKALLLQLSALPLLVGLVLFLCTETVAQTVTTKEPKIGAKTVEMPLNDGNKDAQRDRYYKGVQVIIHDEDGKKIIDKPYEELTEAEKDKHMAPIPQLGGRKTLSVKQFEDLKDSKKYFVTIDNKPVDKKQLDDFEPNDFVDYFNVPGFTDAETGELVLPQYMLLTDNYYKTNLENSKRYEYSSYVVHVGFDMGKTIRGGKQ